MSYNIKTCLFFHNTFLDNAFSTNNVYFAFEGHVYNIGFLVLNNPKYSPHLLSLE